MELFKRCIWDRAIPPVYSALFVASQGLLRKIAALQALPNDTVKLSNISRGAAGNMQGRSGADLSGDAPNTF